MRAIETSQGRGQTHGISADFVVSSSLDPSRLIIHPSRSVDGLDLTGGHFSALAALELIHIINTVHTVAAVTSRSAHGQTQLQKKQEA